ncbi:AraC family transcriptional regulator ligand-binding domain-containing protein [Fontimonas sp. SYSU GA230001]|uniref:AraC family transcriptional regulator n=1 Tax=Fontimonas sp. SYSU GA230001 TaxID=3142450 RepID=UPI0032B3B7F8
MNTRPILGLMYTLQGLQQLGEDVAPVLERHGLPLATLDPAARIDRALELQIHVEIAERLRDPLAGLKSGQAFGFAGYGPLTMLLMTCANGFEAMRTGVHYQRLTYLYSALDFQQGPRLSALVLTPIPLPRRAFRFRMDGEMSGTYKLLRDIQTSLGINLNAEHIDMPYPRPPEAAAYAAYFGCPVVFGEQQGRFWVRNEDLERPFPTHDPAAQKIYRRLCDEQLQAQRRELQELSARVVQQLQLYDRQYPDAVRVARLFGLSERSFRRRLSEEGTSYRRLLAQARFAKAQHLLRETGLSVEAVSEQLGYAEPAAFIHAFRRWSGTSPLAFRARRGDAGPAGAAARR